MILGIDSDFNEVQSNTDKDMVVPDIRTQGLEKL